MNDISRIPIQSLGAVFSLTDLLPELPLPSALPHGSSSESFFTDPATANEAQQCLFTKDEGMIARITEALSKVSTESIDLIDENVAEPITDFPPPPLLVSVLQRNASVFNPNLPIPPAMISNWEKYHSGLEGAGSYAPPKRKHKKKKRKRQRSEHTDQDALSDADSDADPDSDDSSNIDDSANAQAAYEVKRTTESGLKLVIKRPASGVTSTPLESKEKRRKKSKERERKHRSRDKDISLDSSASSMIPTLNGGAGGGGNIGAAMTGKPVVTSSSVSVRKLPPDGVPEPPPPPFDFAAFQESFLKDLPTGPSHHQQPPLNYDFLTAELLSPLSQQQHQHHQQQPSSASVSHVAEDNSGSGVYRGPFMIAAHLDYDTQSPMAPNHQQHQMAPQIPPVQPESQVAPMGLASYLNTSKPPSSAAPTTSRPQQPPQHPQPLPKVAPAKPAGARRRAPVTKRRRKNELEGLRSWTVNYPDQKNSDRHSDESSAWDAAVDRHANYLREKRRRATRQPASLTANYVLENDKDYPRPLPRRGSTEDVDAIPDGDVVSDSEEIHTRSGGVEGRCSYAGMDDDPDVPDDECFKDESASRRRRKVDDDDAPFEVRIKEPAEQRFPHLQKVAAKSARPIRERVHHKAINSYGDAGASVSESVLAGSLKKFLTHIDHVLEAVEEVDLLAGSSGGGDDDSIPTEAIISLSDIAELVRDTAKLKSTHAANQVPTDRLLKLLTLLLLNIKDGASVVRLPGDQESIEKISRAVGASLVALNLMTSRDMPREIYLEDVIEQAVQVARFQLSNCIYPEYDPAYRIENSAKDNQSSIKSRRARERDTEKSPQVVQLYFRLVELVAGLAELVNIQRLTESLVLTLYSVGVSIFFVENVSELQLAGLKLVTGVFAKYSMVRKLIIEEIITGIARLPSSKRNLRTYRLNSEESIQMFTALALLLVQSVIELPQASSSNEKSANGGNEASQMFEATVGKDGNVASTYKPDDEVVVVSSYKKAVLTAHNFLLAFLVKSTTKGEDDYRMVFENFVNDLLLTVNKPEWPAAELMLSLLGGLLVQQFNNKALDQSIRVTSVDYLGTVASTLRRDAVTSQLKEHDINVILRELTEGSQSDSEEEEMESQQQKAEEGADIKATDSPKDEKSAKPGSSKKRSKVNLSKMDRILVLRDAVLDYLLEDECDPVVIYACKFYMGQWLEDCTGEVRRAQKLAAEGGSQSAEAPSATTTTPQKASRRGKRLKIEEDSEDATQPPANEPTEVEMAEMRRAYLMDRVRDPPSIWRARCRPKVAGMLSLASAPLPTSVTAKQSESMRVMFKGSIDYEDAYLICRYLASLRPFAQSFDVYLSHICKLLNESSVPVRTKALRCLSAVVEADPGVLARTDIEFAVRARLMDTSTSVREAAVDLLGRFLICRPELTAQYYPMLSDRIRDKGVSVRKRVIRILRDICVEQPDFPRIAEICVMIIRRINDEESVKKLVSEVFQTLWFTPVREKESVKLQHKVMNITDVVTAATKDTGVDWLEQFLESLLTKDECDKVRPAEKACEQIVECLAQNIMRLDEIPGQTRRLVACLATLHLFTKIRPHLTVKHAMMLQPYLSTRYSVVGGATITQQTDALVLHYVARILEVTVPLIEHPAEAFLAQLEEDLTRLTLKQGKTVLESAVACLGAVVNKVSKNYRLVMQCFCGFFSALVSYRNDCLASPNAMPELSPRLRPSILRSLFTVGLLCKHFDISVFSASSEAYASTLEHVFDVLMFFSEKVVQDLEVQKNALSGLGFLCTRHKELLSGTSLCDFYHRILQAEVDPDVEKSPALELKNLVLENLLSFFLEEERRMLEQDAKWKATHKEESLKVMGDVASGAGSSVAQAYLKEIMQTFFSPNSGVRLTALSVVTTILRQGLIHPVQTVSYLIAMQTDPDATIRVKAETQLQEIENKFPGFIYMRAIEGVCYSYLLQRVIHRVNKANPSSAAEQRKNNNTSTSSLNSTSTTTPVKPSTRRSAAAAANATNGGNEGEASSSADAAAAAAFADAIRGASEVDTDVPNALNSQLYSMLRSNRTSRRAFLNGLINLFDEMQDISLGRLVYVADNLAFFPYQCQAEPLFVIHHIDLLVSVNGSTRLQAIREAFLPELKDLLAQQASHQQQQPLPPPQMDPFGQFIPVPPPTSSAFYTTSNGVSISTNTPAEVNAALTRLEAEEESEEALVSRLLAADALQLAVIRESIKASRACLLLLNLKQYLKEVYGITDSKIQKYSPSDSGKLWEKQLTRKAGIRFFPCLCLRSAIEEEEATSTGGRKKEEQADGITEQAARELVQEFLEFRKLILSIDPPDEEGLGEPGNPLAATLNPDGSGGGPTTVGVEDKTAVAQVYDMSLRLGPDRSLVPQSHNRSSDEEDDSADSDVGGASRLLLAQSAPQRRRGTANRNSRVSRTSGGGGGGGGGAPAPTSKRKSSRARGNRSFLSSSDSESEGDALTSEEEDDAIY